MPKQLVLHVIHSFIVNSKPKFSLLGPLRSGSLQSPVSQGPRQPLHKWSPVQSDPDPVCSWSRRSSWQSADELHISKVVSSCYHQLC